MAKNPIFLTEAELLRGIALLTSNAQIMEKARHSETMISAQESALLQALFAYPNHSAQEIAQKLSMSKQALSRHLKKMHELGYITISSDPDDKRIKRLLLSTKGIAYYTTQQKYALEAFYAAYKKAGLEAVEGFHRVQIALAQFLTQTSR